MKNKNRNAVNKIRRHPELDSGSSTHNVSQRQQPRQTWKIPYQVRDDNPNLTSGLHLTYNNGFPGTPRRSGFTLIELLVVVLIIGILAAVALPQYQKAVEKARAREALPILKSVYQAAQAYHLANGTWPTKFDELAVDIPWTGTTKWRDSHVMTDTRSNDKWSLQIYQETGFGWSLFMGRISGKYAGVAIALNPDGNGKCVEPTDTSTYTFPYNEPDGSYCVKILGATDTPSRYGTYPYNP